MDQELEFVINPALNWYETKLAFKNYLESKGYKKVDFRVWQYRQMLSELRKKVAK